MSSSVAYLSRFPKSATKQAQLYANIVAGMASFYHNLLGTGSTFDQHSYSHSISDEGDYDVDCVMKMFKDHWNVVKDIQSLTLTFTPLK